MKQWDGRDRPQAVELRIPRRDRVRLAQLFEATPPPRPREPQIASVIGLALAVGVLVGVALLLSPSDPVSSKLLH